MHSMSASSPLSSFYFPGSADRLLLFLTCWHVHIARAVADVHCDEHCCCIVRDAEFLRAVADRNASRCVESAGDVIVAALRVSQLLLKSEELRCG